MTTNTKSKAECRTEQASQQSQDKISQDRNTNIPVIEDLKPSLEMLYDLERNEAHQLTQSVKVRAYQDEFEEAIAKLQKGKVSPDFFDNLRNRYSPILTIHAPMPLLAAFGVNTEQSQPDLQLSQTDRDLIISNLIDRLDVLTSLEKAGNITDTEHDELALIQKKLQELGVTE